MKASRSREQCLDAAVAAGCLAQSAMAAAIDVPHPLEMTVENIGKFASAIFAAVREYAGPSDQHRRRS